MERDMIQTKDSQVNLTQIARPTLYLFCPLSIYLSDTNEAKHTEDFQSNSHDIVRACLNDMLWALFILSIKPGPIDLRGTIEVSDVINMI